MAESLEPVRRRKTRRAPGSGKPSAADAATDELGDSDSAEDEPRLPRPGDEGSAVHEPRHDGLAADESVLAGPGPDDWDDDDSAEDDAAPSSSTMGDETSAEAAATPNESDEDSAEDAVTLDGRTDEDSAGYPRHSPDQAQANAEDATADDKSDVIEHRGQRLRKVQSPRQLALQRRKDAVAAALDPPLPPARRGAPPPPAGHDEPPRRRMTVVDDPPVNTGHRAEWSETADEERREGITISEIEAADGEQFPDTAGRGPPRTLTDVCAVYPIGNGQHYIRVERVLPTVYLGVPCAGVMGELTRPMTEQEFRLYYGGGRYELIVYGPDPRGKHDVVTGAPIIKALTKPIFIRVPGNPTAETLIGDPGPGKRSPMFGSQFDPSRRGPPATTADASIHRDSLGMATNLLREEREEKRALQKELQRGASSGVEPIVQAVRDTSKEGMDMLRHELARTRDSADKEIERREEELRAIRRELDAVRQKPTETEGAWKALSQMATAIAPGKSSTDELARIHESHRDEVRRLEDQHRRELVDTRAAFDDRAKILQSQIDSERTRAREEVREVTDRLERREKDAREMFEARLKDHREGAEQRERDAETRQRAELDRIRAEHERELRSAAQQHELVRTTEKQSQEGRMAQLKDRIDILKEEVERWKNEASKNGDWAEQMAEFEKKAEAAGYQKVDANAPQTWQDRIAAAFGDALRNADKIAAAVGKSISDRKDTAMINAHTAAQAGARAALPPAPGQQQQFAQQPGQPQQPQQQRVIRGPGGRPVTPTRSVWATEDMPMAPPPGAQGTPVQQPDAGPPSPVTIGQTAAVAAPPAPAPPPPAPTVPTLPTQPAAQPQQQQGGIDPALLEQFRLWAESEINNKRDPAEFGKAFVERVGVQQAAHIVLNLKVDALFEALSATPEMLQSAILRRDGQQFMRRAWAEAESTCRQALGMPEDG